MLSYIGSYLGYTSTNSSASTTKVTVEISPQQPVTVEVPNNPISIRIINWFAGFVKAMQDKTIEQSSDVCEEIYTVTLDTGHLFSKIYFASEICKDSDLKVNKEKWEICLNKIEGIVESTFQEIYSCFDRIAIGYLHANGMPLFFIKSIGNKDPICFGNQEEIKKSGNCLEHLLDKVGDSNMPNYTTMSNIYRKAREGMPLEIRAKLPLQEPLNQYIGDELFHFLDHKMKEIWDRMVVQYKLKRN